MSSSLFNVFMDAAVKVGMGRMGVRFLEEGREWRLSVVLYADGLVMVGRFVELCR